MEFPRYEHDGCSCSEEYGPCEGHADILAQREGASLRTADELAALFLSEAAYVLEEAAETDASLTETAGRAYTIACKYDDVQGWCDDADRSQALHDDASMVETWLPAGIHVWWNDGYVIARVTAGPLLDA